MPQVGADAEPVADKLEGQRLQPEVATEEIAALVVGSRGRGRVRAGLLGSTCTGVAAMSPVPVVVLPPCVAATARRGH